MEHCFVVYELPEITFWQLYFIYAKTEIKVFRMFGEIYDGK